MEQGPANSHVEAKHDQYRKGPSLDGANGWRRLRLDGLLGRRVNMVAILATAAFFVHQIAIPFGVSTWWADSYLDPLCTVPVVLGIPSLVARQLQPHFTLGWISTLVFTATLAGAFEWWIPTFDHRFTGDPWDAVMYATGAAIWRFVEPQGR